MLDTIIKDLTTAMKEQDKFKLSVLRMLKSALQMEKISKKHDLSDEEVITVIKRQVKTRKDSMEEYKKYNKEDEVQNLEKEIEILNEYLPAEMSDDDINKALDNEKEFVYERHSKREPRSKKEIGISSIRGGTEVGKHSVFFFGNNESFEITHTCTSRSVFANGAIKAAIFLEHKNPGMYNMNDLL